APALLVRTEGSAALPVHAADGTLYFYGSEFTGIHSVARNLGLWSFADGTARRLTDIETVDCERAAGAAVPTASGVVVAVRNRGAVELRRVPLDASGVVLPDLEVLAGQ